MNINIINDRKNSNFRVCIKCENAAMEDLLTELASPYAAISDKNPVLTVAFCENEAPIVKGPCIFIGKCPENLSDCQEFLSRPLDIEAFRELFVKMLSKNAKKYESGWGKDDARKCAVFEEKEVLLTKREFQLYSLLLSRAGEAVSRREIEDILWNGKAEGNSADVYICYLRKKLEKIAGAGVLISVRGLGYMLK